MNNDEKAHHTRPAIPAAEVLAALPPDGGPEWNRLVFEQSPYLLQHAANPVDWWPWGEEAFAEARRLDKPVFLSVGYATCHWCHVMEHESFEDPAIAKLMNDAFVCIKVDREERPDIDHVYMTVTQAITGQGGWPMTVLMTAEKKPFWAGTYLPKNGRYGRPGMAEFIPFMQRMWREERAKLVESAEVIARELGRIGGGTMPGDDMTAATLDAALAEFKERFDPEHGGFGHRPKFPVPHNYMLLLRIWKRTGDPEALAMVEKSLRAMRLGGIFDHVGWGFHRYSTDERWLLPHFEKMLYDQAMMAMAYAEAFAATGKLEFWQVAREVLHYVENEMTASKGGFYSAEDADAEGEEGKFTVWTRAQVEEVLGTADADLWCRVYCFEQGGNFRDEATGHASGANIPHLLRPLGEEFEQEGEGPGTSQGRLAEARWKLYQARAKRVPPFKDDKVLTDWNGLMIAAFAKASIAAPRHEPDEGEPIRLGPPDEVLLLQAGSRAAGFCISNLRGKKGRLLKRWRNGNAGLPAHLDDYAFQAWGMLELYAATFETRRLREACFLADEMLTHFHDDVAGGFFMTAHDGEPLLVRAKEAYDGAIPSGNSVAALVLLKLARITGRTRYEEVAQGVFRAFSPAIERAPSQFSVMLTALDFALGPAQEVVIAEGTGADEMWKLARRGFHPHRTVIWRPAQADPELFALAPYLESMVPKDGRATAYVCRNFACDAPVFTAEELEAKLR